MGGVPETILYVAIFFSICCLGARLYMLSSKIKLDVLEFINKVIVNVVVVTIAAAIIPVFLFHYMDEKLSSFVIISLASVTFSILSIMYVGCKKAERNFVYAKMRILKNKLFKI